MWLALRQSEVMKIACYGQLCARCTVIASYFLQHIHNLTNELQDISFLRSIKEKKEKNLNWNQKK